MLSKNISIGRGSQTLTELSCWRRKWVFKSFPAKKRRIHVWKWQENTSVWQVWNFKCRKNTNVCPSLNFRNCWTYFTDSITQCKSKIISVHMFISVYAFRCYISTYILANTVQKFDICAMWLCGTLGHTSDTPLCLIMFVMRFPPGTLYETTSSAFAFCILLVSLDPSKTRLSDHTADDCLHFRWL